MADARVVVLAPSPILTVTLEREDRETELHLHVGGQGYWVARMLGELGAAVAFCAPLGGETGTVLRALLERERLDLRTIETAGWNGSYVHDRRGEELVEVGRTESPRLSRHESDSLYTAMLTASLEAGVATLTGPRGADVFDPDLYRRLAIDLQANGRPVLADLSGDALTAALAGGLELVHISERELREQADMPLDRPGDLVAAMRRLSGLGARQLVVSRGPEPALALLEDGVHELIGPVFEPREHRGAGDSMFAAVAASLARGDPITDALRLGVAAGSLNVVRRGLGSGIRDDIERLARSVELRPLSAGR